VVIVKSKVHLYFNLWFVFLASGLWHGASWSFVLWGAYHGLFLVLERGFLIKLYDRIGKIPSTIITFFIVVIGWVFFRIEKLSDAIVFLERLFSFDLRNSISPSSEFYTFFTLAVFFAFFTFLGKGQKIQDAIYFSKCSPKLHFAFSFVSIILLVISISSITAFGFNPFIYFRF
jgi:alginate O-acetyltransferase complex protein AlgI